MPRSDVIYKEELNYVAQRLRVHPRTVLRKVEHDQAALWWRGKNPDIDLKRIAEAFGIDWDVLYACLYGDDDLLTLREAAELLDVHPRTIYKWKVTPAVSLTNLVRFSRLSLLQDVGNS